MKFRNGFVSNSSSSSYILFMPKKKLALKEIEDYFGGYTDKLEQKDQDTLTYLMWLSQYKRVGDNYDTDRYELEEDIETKIECIASWEQQQNIYRCNHQGEESCGKCKYLKRITRPARSDDYYTIIDNYWNEEIIAEVKKHEDMNVYELEIDDNNPGKYLDYEQASALSFAEGIFKDHTNVIEVNEH